MATNDDGWKISPPDPKDRRGGPRKMPRRHPKGTTGAERKRLHRERKKAEKKRYIAVLDMETDPFDNTSKARIFPFLAVLYSDEFDPVIIWENDNNKFCAAVIRAINALPNAYTIYAHNGGKFDFLFLIHCIRGEVKFKGRGIMCARIGPHELRDSFHIIPERLAAYQKDAFDYGLLVQTKRAANRDAIIKYCLADCRYLLDIIQTFVNQFGLKLSIGQAAMANIRQHYPDIERFSEGWDAYVRKWYFGGRVQCLKGAGKFTGDYKLIDVNSLYPFVMAEYQHPTGSMFDYVVRGGPIGPNTFFIKLQCENRGAFICRNEIGETVATQDYGVFNTTIHEFNVAIKYGLISNIQILECLDCFKKTSFEKFVLPLYENRQQTKASMAELRSKGLDTTAAYMDLKKDDIFYKLLLNNGYGKFCQNPRRYKEHYITDPGDQPSDEWFRSIYKLNEDERHPFLQPLFESELYWIWSKPSPSFRYNNVGTGASITGAARAVLLEALQLTDDAIYCDTDSIICKNWRGLNIDKVALGAWDLEDEFSEVLIAGKKLYGLKHKKLKNRTKEELERGLVPWYTVKSKGVSGVTWDQMLRILDGDQIETLSRAPTLTKFGDQDYLPRRIKMTTHRSVIQ